MKLLKIIILALKEIWKYKWSYIVQVFELIIIAILFLTMVSKLQGVQESNNTRNAFNADNMYYYSQYQYITKDLKDVLDSELLNQIEIEEIFDVTLATDNGDYYMAYAYSDRIINACTYDIKEGIWLNEYTGDNIPVISLNENIPVGKVIQITTQKKTYSLEIVGYMERDSYILNFCGGASNDSADLSDFISHPTYDLIVPYNCSNVNAIADDAIEEADKAPNCMIFFEDESLVEKVLSECGDYGSVSSVAIMKKNFEEDVKLEMLLNGIVLFVFSVLSISGIVGFNGIQSAIHERDYLIYYFVGGENRNFVLMEVIKNVIVLGASFSIFMLMYKRMSIFQFSANSINVIDFKSILAVFLCMAAISLSTSLWYIRKLNRKQWISAYKLKA